MSKCHDCAVEPGQPHVDGCDTARCTECGWQRISCEHENQDVGWGSIWTGEWPGDVECRELSLWCYFVPKQGFIPCAPDHPEATEDLNRLAMMAASGIVVWNTNQERWVKP